MSLINDALKRASTQKSAAAAPPAYAAPMQPVLDTPRATGPLPIILCIVGVGALLMAGAFWLKSKATPLITAENTISLPRTLAVPEGGRTVEPSVTTQPALQATAGVPARNPAPQVVAATVTPKPAELVAPALTVAPRSALAQVETPTTTPISADHVLAPPQTGQQAEPAPETHSVAAHLSSASPNFRLQAIYYRMKGPTVVVNGKTLKVGDVLDGAKLVSIGRTAAEIEIGGVRQKLTMH